MEGPPCPAPEQLYNCFVFTRGPLSTVRLGSADLGSGGIHPGRIQGEVWDTCQSPCTGSLHSKAEWSVFTCSLGHKGDRVVVRGQEDPWVKMPGLGNKKAALGRQRGRGC